MKTITDRFGLPQDTHPLDILSLLPTIIPKMKGTTRMRTIPDYCAQLSSDARFIYEGHATIQPFVTFDGPIFLGEGAFIGPYVFLRGPLYIGKGVKIGPYSEVTRSIVMDETVIAHKNIIPDSIIGDKVWLSGGCITCNVRLDKKPVRLLWTGIEKSAERFGAVIENNAKLGVNVIAMPGTHVKPNAFVLGPSTIKGVIE